MTNELLDHLTALQRIAETANTILPPGEVAHVTGISIGDRSDLGKPIRDILRCCNSHGAPRVEGLPIVGTGADPERSRLIGKILADIGWNTPDPRLRSGHCIPLRAETIAEIDRLVTRDLEMFRHAAGEAFLEA